MPAHDPLYDLVLMLDSAAPDEQRQRVLTGVETTIASGGEIVNTQDWGVRQMAYEIRHKADTEYHLLQFHGTREVLETLQRTLKIADGVMRFRIIKLAPGTRRPPRTAPSRAPRASARRSQQQRPPRPPRNRPTRSPEPRPPGKTRKPPALARVPATKARRERRDRS
jgi:small subunit ribosomal protein S6